MDVSAWLRSHGLDCYEPAFRDHAIDATMLPKLKDEHLKELDLPRIPRMDRPLAGVRP